MNAFSKLDVTREFVTFVCTADIQAFVLVALRSEANNNRVGNVWWKNKTVTDKYVNRKR
jgi:hypothetical protein